MGHMPMNQTYLYLFLEGRLNTYQIFGPIWVLYRPKSIGIADLHR